MKEYLNVSEKQGQLSSALESSENRTLTGEEKDTCTTNAHNDGESSCQEPEKCSSENDGKEIQNHLQESSTSKDGNYLVPQFKNVVAIVDPPRVGLHPTVSICTLDIPAVVFAPIPLSTMNMTFISLLPCLNLIPVK